MTTSTISMNTGALGYTLPHNPTVEDFKMAAERLVEAAKLSNVVLTIETQPLKPLAMRHYAMVVQARSAR